MQTNKKIETMTTDINTQANETNKELEGTVIFVTAGKRALRWWKKYNGSSDGAYQISKKEALTYLK